MTAPAIASHPLAHRSGLALMWLYFIVCGDTCEKCGAPTVRVNKVKRRCRPCGVTVDWVRNPDEARRRMDARLDALRKEQP